MIGTGRKNGTVALKVNSFVNFEACMEERVTKTFPLAGWRALWFRKTFADSLRALG